MNAEEVLVAAVEKKTPAERAAYLDGACGQDAALRASVEGLLRSHEEAGGFLEQPLFESGPTIDRPVDHEKPGTIIGPYKLLQQIGEGGMGTVFMAEQTEPVQRKVALKVIKAGMDSRQVIARFEAERQALSMMDHVNIARVFDGGTIESSRHTPCAVAAADDGTRSVPATLGRPYFVMELVHGVPITKYCDDNQLTPRERLELFVPVCQAIQHAHQKGIIHRDIKPSNVMITLYDGKPVPKVIDFGVAKATEQKLTERTLFTQYGTMVGTLEYMSPEQAEMSALGVDTRSDIFSLGVLLYELLTGSTPLSRKRLKEAAYAEILRMIKEEEPPKPSTRLSDSGKALASISAQRHMEPGKLSKLMRGELDWIVMKTLEKDRNRRYETASGFAADVQRYLNNEAVQACPPSSVYRFRKFARRNKGPVLAATLVLLAMVGGIVGATWGLIQSKDARAQAEARETETRAVLDFVENKVFAAARPKGTPGGLGYEVTLREAVEAALPFVESSFTDQPLIEARLRMTLGRSFRALGDPKIGDEQFQAARTLFTKHRGPDHPDTLMSINYLANNPANRDAVALKRSEEALGLMKAKLGPDHPDTLSSMFALSNSYTGLGRHADALKLREETLALRNAKLGPDHPDTLASMNSVALSYAALGRHADALKLQEETLALRKGKLGPDDPDTLYSMNNLVISYYNLGRYTDALKLNQETLALWKAKLGPDHPQTLMSMNNLALCYSAVGRYADALKLREETLALRKAKLGPDHPDIAFSMSALANSYAEVGRHADALKLFEEVLALTKPKLGYYRHDATVNSMNGLAWLLATCPDPKFRDVRRAVEMAKKAVELAPKEGAYWNTLGAAHYCAGDWKGAIEALEKSVELGRGGDSFDWFFRAMAHCQLGRKDEGRKWYDRAVEWMEKNKPQDEELRRFRAEAAQLLGVPEAPKKGNDAKSEKAKSKSP